MAKPYVAYEGPIVTREAARAAGLFRFFTGKPCKHGHLSERTTANGGCIACNAATAIALYHAETPDKRAARQAKNKVWKDAHREQVRAEGRAYSKAHRAQSNAWKAANREKVNAGSRAAYDPEKRRAYYQSRREELLAACSARYFANPEGVKRRAKEWVQNNPDRALDNRQAYYAANKAKILEKVAAWNEANPGGQRTRGRNYRARGYAAEGSHTRQEIQALYEKQNGICVYCDALLGTSYHADHIIPLVRGGSNWIANIQLTCGPCNNRKRAIDPAEFARRLKRKE